MDIDNKIFVQSPTISDYLKSRFLEEIESEIQKRTENQKAFDAQTPHHPSATNTQLGSLAKQARGFVISQIPKHVLMDFFERVKPELQTGDIVALGLKDDNTDNSPEIIPANFWLRATIDGWLTKASSNEQRFIDLRIWNKAVETPEALATAQHKTKHPSLEKVPPPKDMRPLAIAGCFNEGRIAFENSSLTMRASQYREWIAEQYPTCDVYQRGYNDKSFERDETQFKKNNGLTRSSK